MSRLVIFSDWVYIPCQELLSLSDRDIPCQDLRLRPYIKTCYLIETVYHAKICYLFWLRPYTMSLLSFQDLIVKSCYLFWLRTYAMSRVVIFPVYHSRVVFFSYWDRIPCQELLSFLLETVYHVKTCYLFWLRPYTVSRLVIFSDWERIPCQELLSFLIETIYHVKSCYPFWQRPSRVVIYWLRPYTMSRIVIFSDWDRIPCQELLSFLFETVYNVKSCYHFWLRPYTMSRVVIFSDWDRIPCQELLSFLIETVYQV